MDPKVAVTIFFLGIAAIVNVPPYNNVTKAVIFPAAPAGVSYQGAGDPEPVHLMPHKTWLYVKNLENPDVDCPKIGTIMNPTATIANKICKAELQGARLWVSPSEQLTEDSTFRKIPSFMNFNKEAAMDLSQEYISQEKVDPALVAARFDIKGGTVSGCNRQQAFVAKIATTTNDGALYVQQNGRTARLVMKTGAVIAIENRADSAASQTMTMRGDHYGWYYVMNQKRLEEMAASAPALPNLLAQTTPVSVTNCSTIPGPDDEVTASAAGSAECSVTNFP